jgi:hypothetical protein
MKLRYEITLVGGEVVKTWLPILSYRIHDNILTGYSQSSLDGYALCAIPLERISTVVLVEDK